MPAEDRNAFFKYIGESQPSSLAILKAKPGNRDARYFLGAAEGVLAAFAITIDHNKRETFRHGKRAYQYQLGIVEEQWDYYDSYVTIGLYEYIVANLPWYMKWIAQIAGYKGTTERGFNYLRLAATKPEFVSVNARNVLVVLCLREKLYHEALENAQFLHLRGDRQQAVSNYQQVLSAANFEDPHSTAQVYLKTPYRRGK